MYWATRDNYTLSKLTVIIIMGFGENVLWPKYIDIYQFRG